MNALMQIEYQNNFEVTSAELNNEKEKLINLNETLESNNIRNLITFPRI